MSKDLLGVFNLKKEFGDSVAVKEISFCVKEGEIIGLLGPNGAGKTTTIKMLTGIENLTKGDIFFYGEKINDNFNKLKSNLGVVPQEIAIYEDLSAYNNVSFFCSLYGYSGKELKKERRRHWNLQVYGRERMNCQANFQGE